MVFKVLNNAFTPPLQEGCAPGGQGPQGRMHVHGPAGIQRGPGSADGAGHDPARRRWAGGVGRQPEGHGDRAEGRQGEGHPGRHLRLRRPARSHDLR